MGQIRWAIREASMAGLLFRLRLKIVSGGIGGIVDLHRRLCETASPHQFMEGLFRMNL